MHFILFYFILFYFISSSSSIISIIIIYLFKIFCMKYPQAWFQKY